LTTTKTQTNKTKTTESACFHSLTIH